MHSHIEMYLEIWVNLLDLKENDKQSLSTSFFSSLPFFLLGLFQENISNLNAYLHYSKTYEVEILKDFYKK